MIQKISLMTDVSKTPARYALKSIKSRLKSLAGSSMSGWNPPRLYESEMIIPGGLNFKEKAYYLLKGRLPKSVYERWIPNDGDHIINDGDQLVTVDRTYSGGVVDIVEGPHDPILGQGDDSHGLIDDISSPDGMVGPNSEVVSGDESDISLLEIWQHLAGIH